MVNIKRVNVRKDVQSERFVIIIINYKMFSRICKDSVILGWNDNNSSEFSHSNCQYYDFGC